MNREEQAPEFITFSKKNNLFTIENMEEILDIIDSENSGLSHQDRLNEISKLIKNLLT